MKKKGHYYFAGLNHALTYGIDHFAEDTAERTEFFKEHQHLIAGTMLVSMFAFLESTLGENWIERCGGKQTRELKCLKFIRDAFVHKNGHIRDLGSHTQEKEDDLRSFIDELSNGKVTDDKGNVYPCYIEITNESVVKLNEKAMHILSVIGKTICH